MTNPETQDEYITSDTDAGFRKVIEALAHEYTSVEVYDRQDDGCMGWVKPDGDFINLLQYMSNGMIARIYNKNYIKQPKRGEIWTWRNGNDDVERVVVLGGNPNGCYISCYRKGYVGKLTQSWFIEFTGEKTDLFDKLDALTDGGCDANS